MRMTDKEKLEMIQIIEDLYLNDVRYNSKRLHRMMGFDYSLYEHEREDFESSSVPFGYDCIMHMPNNKTKKLGEIFLRNESRTGK